MLVRQYQQVTNHQAHRDPYRLVNHLVQAYHLVLAYRHLNHFINRPVYRRVVHLVQAYHQAQAYRPHNHIIAHQVHHHPFIPLNRQVHHQALVHRRVTLNNRQKYQ